MAHKAHTALLDLDSAKDGEQGGEKDKKGGGKKGGAGSDKARRGRAGDQARHFSAKSRGVMQSRNELVLPPRFDLVSEWWGKGQGRSDPMTFELKQDSPAAIAAGPVPTVIMNELLAKHGSVFIAKSTAFNVIFKQVWVEDERAEEVVDERACFEELYKYDDAADYLIGYVGFYESVDESHYLLVTEAGEALVDWRKESDTIIHLVKQLHRHGFIHGDLALRNVVRTPRGLRLIDLGRARRANADELAEEMKLLKQALAGDAVEVDYEWLGYDTR